MVGTAPCRGRQEERGRRGRRQGARGCLRREPMRLVCLAMAAILG